jgi:hypothetical protein
MEIASSLNDTQVATNCSKDANAKLYVKANLRFIFSPLNIKNNKIILKNSSDRGP